MGRSVSGNLTMKLLLVCVAAITISTSSAKGTCEDCTAVVNSMSAYLTSEESLRKQVDILLADVCPQVEASEECVAGLPDFWMPVAMVLWPGYYNADAEWMCAPLCKAREITCEECFEGLQKGVEQLLQEETIAAIVEALSGDAFCAQEEDPERCATVIQTLIPLALPALTANPDEEAGKMVCNGAIPDICS